MTYKMEGKVMVGRTILGVLLVVLTVAFQQPMNEVTIDAETTYEYCNFCDDHELTTKEKCEELLWKCLTDEKNWLEEGIITREVYELQVEPFNKALEHLAVASDEEIEEIYKELLLANLDWLEEDKASGEEIDEAFYEYIISELNNTPY